jgi:CBS domain-containing protein
MDAKLPAVPDFETTPAAHEFLLATRHHGMPVVDAGGRLVGIPTRQDVDRALAEPGGTTKTVAEVCSRDLLVAHAD